MPGCTDKADPALDLPIRIPHELYFAREESGWGKGGVAFLRPTADSTHETFGRMYLITREQFLEVVAQENDAPFKRIVDALGSVEFKPNGRHDLGFGWYDRVLCLGETEGIPVVTFTSKDDLSEQPTRPSVEYLTTILRGLIETHRTHTSFPSRLHEPEEIVAYMAAATQGLWTKPELTTLLGQCRDT